VFNAAPKDKCFIEEKIINKKSNYHSRTTNSSTEICSNGQKLCRSQFFSNHITTSAKLYYA
jgi:hypothetical protein